MKIIFAGLLLPCLLACATETRRESLDLTPYLDGYAAQKPVEPAEFPYENPNASLWVSGPDRPVTFETIRAEALDGGLDWPEPPRAGLAAEEYDDYDPNAEFGSYGNEYGGNAHGGRGRRRPANRPKPRPESGPKELGQGTTAPGKPADRPSPEIGRDGRRKARSAPVAPPRIDRRSAPARPRRD